MALFFYGKTNCWWFNCSFQGARSARGCGIDGAPCNTQGVYGATPRSPNVDTSKYEVNMMDFLSWFHTFRHLFGGWVFYRDSIYGDYMAIIYGHFMDHK